MGRTKAKYVKSGANDKMIAVGVAGPWGNARQADNEQATVRCTYGERTVAQEGSKHDTYNLLKTGWSSRIWINTKPSGKEDMQANAYRTPLIPLLHFLPYYHALTNVLRLITHQAFAQELMDT